MTPSAYREDRIVPDHFQDLKAQIEAEDERAAWFFQLLCWTAGREAGEAEAFADIMDAFETRDRELLKEGIAALGAAMARGGFNAGFIMGRMGRKGLTKIIERWES